MATVNSVNVGLSGSTGTGSFVGSNSPTLVTPALGAASATSLTFTSTTGIIGTTTNNNAASGSVGQFLSSVVLASAPVTLTTVTPADLTSITLTPGDWDVWGNIGFTGGATTNVLYVIGWISSTSATLPDASLCNSLAYAVTGIVPFNENSLAFQLPAQRFSVSNSGNITVYASGQASFTVSSCGIFGQLFARRRR